MKIIVNHFNLLTLLFLMLNVLSSCNKDESPIDRIRISSDLLISLETTIDSQVLLLTRTEKTYSTSSYQIVTKVEKDDNGVVIYYKYINKCDICTTALGPAVSAVDISEYAFDAKIDLELWLKGKKYKGHIASGVVSLLDDGKIRVE